MQKKEKKITANASTLHHKLICNSSMFPRKQEKMHILVHPEIEITAEIGVSTEISLKYHNGSSSRFESQCLRLWPLLNLSLRYLL